MNRRWIYVMLPIVGTIFCLVYIHMATVDVVYSDYIRLINSYLPNVWDPDKFFVPDLLTRIPINYLGRLINVEVFGLSLQADRIAGVLGLGLSAWILGIYSRRQEISALWFGLLMVIVFSLNKWEMLVNGSGWAHFLAFALFYYHFMAVDRYRRGEMGEKGPVLLAIFPFIITLGVAGPYCAIYTATLLLTYGWFWLLDLLDGKKDRRTWVILGLCALIPLILYMISNSTLTEDYDRNSISASLLSSMMENPKFFIKFFLKSFASMVLGGEVISLKLHLTGTQASVIGLLVLAAYVLALWFNVRYRIYERTIFPLMCLAAGGMNHLLILVSRWIFLDEDYGMSSRYALQFQVGIVGMVLTFALAARCREWKRERLALRWLPLAVSLVFLLGNLYTTAEELHKAKYRKENGLLKVEAVLHYKELDDEELSSVIEYTRGADKIRNALQILEENHLNVFRQEDTR